MFPRTFLALRTQPLLRCAAFHSSTRSLALTGEQVAKVYDQHYAPASSRMVRSLLHTNIVPSGCPAYRAAFHSARSPECIFIVFVCCDACQTKIAVESAKGAWIKDSITGKSYLDFTCGIGATNTGHCHPTCVICGCGSSACVCLTLLCCACCLPQCRGSSAGPSREGDSLAAGMIQLSFSV